MYQCLRLVLSSQLFCISQLTHQVSVQESHRKCSLVSLRKLRMSDHGWGDFLLWRFSHCLWLCQPYLPQLFLSSHISSMNLIRAFLFCSYIQNRLENLCIWLQTVTKLGTLINISIVHFQELWKWIYSSGLILTSSMIIFINSTSFSILGNNSVW